MPDWKPEILRRLASLDLDPAREEEISVDERADGVHLSYDRMTSLLAPYENRDALEVARDLGRKVQDLLGCAAA
jgi:hypothetical protein